MKVATLTLPLHDNYGACFQALALQRYLQKENYESEVINISDTLGKNDFDSVCKLLKKKIKLFLGMERRISKAFERFIELEIKKTEKIYLRSSYRKQLNSGYYSIFVGSDQVWRSDYVSDLGIYYLKDLNTPSTYPVAYAASFGKDELLYSYNNIELAKKCLRNFKQISVRESSGVRLCSEFFNIDVGKNVDPIFLLDRMDYVNIANNYLDDSKRKIFCYILDLNEYKYSLIKYISHKLNINFEILNDSLSRESKKSPYEWLYKIINSDYVITDSFHGVAFSILFNKRFLAIGNTSRGLSRFESILNDFNLHDRLITEETDYSQALKKLKQSSNDKEIQEKISILRSTAKCFIKKALVFHK